MQVQMIHANEHKTSRWAGGETTQLFLFPPDGSYNDQNFLFRISSATVTTETSDFTKLPGIQRKLLVLEGKLRLTHNKNVGKWLAENEQEAFSGDWETKSEGKVIDFNLMMKDGVKGEVQSIQLPPKDKENCIVYLGESKKCFLIFYVYEGQITIEDGYEKKIIKEKELAVIEMKEDTKVNGFVIENPLASKVRFIKTEVYLY